MEGWQQNWWKMFDSIAHDIEQFLVDATQELSGMADTLIEFSEEVAEQLEDAIAPHIDRLDEHLDEWLVPILQTLDQFESDLDHAVEPVTHTIEPILNEHPICAGCRHYHGRMYGGNLLICAMHPYGIVDGSDYCADKEPTSWSFLPDPRSQTARDD